MFVYQAQEAFKIWHGIKPEISHNTLKLLNDQNWNFRKNWIREKLRRG